MDLAKFYPEDSSEATAKSDIRDIVARSYTSIGSIEGYGKIEVDAYEFAIPDRRHLEYFVRISVTTSGDYPQGASTAVPYHNMQRLIIALEQLSKVAISTDRFKFTEVEFAIDDLKIVAFNTYSNSGFIRDTPAVKLCFSVSVSGYSVNFSRFDQIRDLIDLLSKSKQYIEVNGIAL